MEIRCVLADKGNYTLEMRHIIVLYVLTDYSVICRKCIFLLCIVCLQPTIEKSGNTAFALKCARKSIDVIVTEDIFLLLLLYR